jgi:hypothetical protein
VIAPELKTTLLLIPGGRELALPQNGVKFKTALQHAVANKTAQIIMLADEAVVPEKIVQSKYDFKNVLLIESDKINTTDDAWLLANHILEDHLPVLSEAGFDYQVVKMEFVKVAYEDFERIAKFL